MKSILLILIFQVFSIYSFSQKKILFDATKAETAANADWVLDADSRNLKFYSNGTVSTGGSEANAQRYPTPAQSGITASTPETYWTGALSMFGIEMVKKGYSVETLPWNVPITFGDPTNVQDLSNYDVFVLCEPNIMFTASEKTAILAFVNAGGGLLMMADHGNPTPADRNNDGNSAIDVLNDLMAGNPFGIQFDDVTISQNTTNVTNLPGDPLLHGIAGDVAEHELHGSTTLTLNKTANSTVKGIIYKSGSSNTGLTNCFVAYATYGSGKFVGMGDSSPAEDVTGDPGDVTYDGWIQPTNGSNIGDNGQLITNATIWLAGTGPVLSVSPIALTGFSYIFGAGPSTSKNFTISGSTLTGSSVTITGSVNYEVSSDNITFSNSKIINYSTSTLNSTTINVRLKSGLAVGSYNNESITCSDNGGATAKTITVSGSVSAYGGSSAVCATEGFDGGTVAPVGWTFTNIAATYITAGNFGALSPSLKMDATGDIIETPVVTNASQLKFWLKAQTVTGSYLLIEGFNGTAWTQVDNILLNTYGTATVITYNATSVPALVSGFSKFRFTFTKSAGNLAFDDVEITCGTLVTPEITISSSTMNFGNQCNGVLYTEKSYKVSGSGLTSNLIITPPSGFEISLTSGSGFVSSPSFLTIIPSSGVINSTIVFVRFSPIVVQSYSGNITHVSTGATSKNMAVSGSGENRPPIVNVPVSNGITSNTANMGGNLIDEGCSDVTETGIYWSTISGFTPPTAGTKVSVSGIFTVGSFVVPVSGLPNGTTLYFKAFATNSGGTSYSSQASFSTLTPQGFSISGDILYNNSTFTGMGNTPVNLMNGTTIIASTVTDVSGNFVFTNIPNGTYTVSASTSKAWGGVNSTDALKMKRHISSLEFLIEPIRLTAADVNMSGTINSTDVLKVQRRISSLDLSFTQSDWIFEKAVVGGKTIIVNNANVNQQFYAICTGDVNGTHIPVLMKIKK